MSKRLPEDPIYEKAKLLAKSIDGALIRGVKHYRRDGTLLLTRKEILTCMIQEGDVLVEEPPPAGEPDAGTES